MSKDDFDVLAYGISSTIYKKRQSDVVVKISSFSVEPHDIRKELAILRRISHPNVIPVLDVDEGLGEEVAIWMPYIPFSLDDFLNSPYFSPHPVPVGARRSLGPKGFTELTRSFLSQLVSALAHLHKEGIGHRDIKPSNILITPHGWLRLIDFGVSFLPSSDEEVGYPESATEMYFEVCTGPYRPPELLFSPHCYDATKVDMWSLGCLLAGLFTTLRLLDEDEDDETDAGEDRDKPFVFASCSQGKWVRDSLFNASRGEIGLAWSIFRILGTPNEETWPEFASLPSASAVQFMSVPKVPLEPLLPHLPQEGREVFLRLVEGCLTYPTHKRCSAGEALQIILEGEEMVLPVGYPREGRDGLDRLVREGLQGVSGENSG